MYRGVVERVVDSEQLGLGIPASQQHVVVVVVHMSQQDL